MGCVNEKNCLDTVGKVKKETTPRILINTFHGIDAGQHSHRKSAERQLCQQETLQHRVESRWSQYSPPAAVPA